MYLFLYTPSGTVAKDVQALAEKDVRDRGVAQLQRHCLNTVLVMYRNSTGSKVTSLTRAKGSCRETS